MPALKVGKLDPGATVSHPTNDPQPEPWKLGQGSDPQPEPWAPHGPDPTPDNNNR